MYHWRHEAIERKLMTRKGGFMLVKRDPEIMSGALCFDGTRVPVSILFEYVEGSSLDEFLIDFPSISREFAVEVLKLAHKRLIADASTS
jgi:uncharacterized protein (DUF433 family)